MKFLYNLDWKSEACVYWQTLKTQHLDNSFILCLEKKAEQ